jgi:mannosyltransferase
LIAGANGVAAMTEPQTVHGLWKAHNHGAEESHPPLINASIISLVRNDELEGILASMRQVEASWNSKFNYPWTFFNNDPFTDEFKRRTQAETKMQCRYGVYMSL